MVFFRSYRTSQYVHSLQPLTFVLVDLQDSKPVQSMVVNEPCRRKQIRLVVEKFL